MPELTHALLTPFLGLPTNPITLTAQAYTTDVNDLGTLAQVATGGSDGTITLMSAVTAGDGAVQYVRKSDGGAGKVVITDGAVRANLFVQDDLVGFRSDGAAWTPVDWKIRPIKTVFTVSGTWAKDPLARRVRVLAFGQGGGGSSGQRRATGAIRTGGGPGGPGAVVQMELLAAILGSTETVVIPTNATAGAAITTNDTVGAIGAQGSPTTYGSWLQAVAGVPGGAVTAGGAPAALGSAQPGGGSQLTQTNVGIPNAGTSSATTTSTPTLAAAGQVGAGAPGAGATAANTLAPTTAGPNGSTYSGTPTTGGTAGSAGNAGGAGASVSDTDSQTGGGGGGGGFWATGSAGTAGGTGGAPGGGGGGGGASDNGFNSGSGGAGARGEIRIWQYFE